MKPLLAHVYEPYRVTFPCFVQPKLNGIRALYQNGSFQSRDEHPFPPGLLQHLAEPLLAAFGPEVILDGELYVHGWPLQKINAAVTPVRKEENEDTKSVEYHVFDVIDLNRSFEQRLMKNSFNKIQLLFELGTRLAQGLSNCKIRGVTTIKAKTDINANILYARFVEQGYEGLMYRLGDCPYTLPKQLASSYSNTFAKGRTKFLSDQDNRCWHLLKRKSWQDDEFEVVGVVEGEGKYEGMLGAITCRTYQTHSSCAIVERDFSVGSGFSDSDRQKFWDYPMLAIGHKAKVKFLCLSEDGIPLNPTLLAIL